MSRFRLPSLPQRHRPRPAANVPTVLGELKSILEQLAAGETVIIAPGSAKACDIAVAVAEAQRRRSEPH